MPEKKYIVATLFTGTPEEARELAKRKAKEDQATAYIGEVIEEVKLEYKKSSIECIKEYGLCMYKYEKTCLYKGVCPSQKGAKEKK